MMDTDGPIVAAVREARARFAAECNYDLDCMVKRLREIEAANAGRIRHTPQKTNIRPEATRK